MKAILLFISLITLVACGDKSKPASSIAEAAVVTAQPSKKIMGVESDTLDLTKFGIATNPGNILGGLQVGDKAPNFTMKDQDGKEVSLANSLKKGSVLLVFLRAEWCSFCVRHLKEFQDNIQAINDNGHTQVLAVSPQTPNYMKDFHAENEFSFPILYDDDHSVMSNYKVLFHVTEKYNAYIEKAKGNRIEVFNGDKEPVMPVPATYLIGQDGVIDYVHYDPDYKKRSDLKEVMAKL
jgi:peroxiredoxin